MAKQSFLLVSLQEDKAKKLAQVVTNENCRKVLDYLADKDKLVIFGRRIDDDSILHCIRVFKI